METAVTALIALIGGGAALNNRLHNRINNVHDRISGLDRRIDAIELSGGTSLKISNYSSSRVSESDSKEEEVYYRDAAKLYKEKISVPLILVGGIRSYRVAKALIEKDLADYISLCRPLIREPDLINRWKRGNTERASCISCNRCFEPTRAGKGIYCVIENER